MGLNGFSPACSKRIVANTIIAACAPVILPLPFKAKPILIPYVGEKRSRQ